MVMGDVGETRAGELNPEQEQSVIKDDVISLANRSGLSAIQRRILDCLERRHDEGQEVVERETLLVDVYGVQMVERRFAAGGKYTIARGHPNFRSVTASLSRTLTRLQARGLIAQKHGIVGVYGGRVDPEINYWGWQSAAFAEQCKPLSTRWHCTNYWVERGLAPEAEWFTPREPGEGDAELAERSASKSVNALVELFAASKRRNLTDLIYDLSFTGALDLFAREDLEKLHGLLSEILEPSL